MDTIGKAAIVDTAILILPMTLCAIATFMLYRRNTELELELAFIRSRNRAVRDELRAMKRGVIR